MVHAVINIQLHLQCLMSRLITRSFTSLTLYFATNLHAKYEYNMLTLSNVC